MMRNARLRRIRKQAVLQQFPELRGMKRRDLERALIMGRNIYDSLVIAAQPDLKARLQAMATLLGIELSEVL